MGQIRFGKTFSGALSLTGPWGLMYCTRRLTCGRVVLMSVAELGGAMAAYRVRILMSLPLLLLLLLVLQILL